MKIKQKSKKKLTLNQLTICKLNSSSLNIIKSGDAPQTLHGGTCEDACNPTLCECDVNP